MRHLDWEGCINVRDLGGLRTAADRQTARGRIVRADALDRLTAAGWAAATAYGVRTVIDLREPDEIRTDIAPRPQSITTVHLPLDGADDREFWDAWDSGPQFATPLYYLPHLERFPERSAAVLTTIARARPGAVVVHCAGGRDRTGQIAMLLLALAGVVAEEIADDYALSAERMRDKNAETFLAARGTTARELILAVLAELDVEASLRAGGLTEIDVAALRRRLLD